MAIAARSWDRTPFLFALAIGMAGATASAGVSPDVIWDESIDGDLGELYRYSTPQPTDSIVNLGTLALGSSTIIGTNLQSSSIFGNTFEGDAVRITIAPGTTLNQIVFKHNQSVGLREFLRLNPNGTVAQTYVFRSFPATELSSPNYGVWVQHELVGQFASGGPLLPGEYLLSWDNATFNTTMQYEIDFVVVPAPGVGVVLAGMGLVAARRRRA
jgi:hypothetical protein